MKEIAKLAIKIMAIYFFIDFINESFNQIFWIFNSGSKVRIYIIFGTITALLIKLIISLILWFKADLISNSIINKEDELSLKFDEYKKLHLIAFSVVGLILLVITVPDLFRNIFEYLSYPNRPISNYLPQLIGEVIKIIIGFWLLYDSKNLVNRIQPK
ncbi:MAG: hypothetical protein ACQEQH_06830 [Bacillota bacterium]